MKIKKIYVIILFSLLNTVIMRETKAQTHCYNKLIKDYLISKGELNNNEKTSIYSFEVLKSNSINDNVFGIYRIGTFSDHGLIYLFLLDKKNEKEIFLDFEDMPSTIEAVLSFMDGASYKLNDSEKLAYIRKALDIYRINERKIPW